MARKSKQPAKMTVVCPHCGGRQKESVFAQSTICTGCGGHFAIGANEPRPERVVLRGQAPESGMAPGLFQSLSGLLDKTFSAKRGPRRIVCHECGARSEASRAAQSTACPKCGAYIDLQDVLVDRAVSRAVRTQGDLTVTSKGRLSSSRAYVANAVVEGGVEGSLVACGRILLKRVGALAGSLHAEEIEVGKRASVKLLRSAHARTIIVRGAVEGELHATGSVVVHKRGRLTGKIFARGFRVDKGGEFHGSLQIGGFVPPERAAGSSAPSRQQPAPVANDALPAIPPAPKPSHA